MTTNEDVDDSMTLLKLSVSPLASSLLFILNSEMLCKCFGCRSGVDMAFHHIQIPLDSSSNIITGGPLHFGVVSVTHALLAESPTKECRDASDSLFHRLRRLQSATLEDDAHTSTTSLE